MSSVITNSVLISILGTLAVVGCIFVLEGTLRFLKGLLAKARPREAFRLSIGAENGFGFQLGTSTWITWLRMTKEARKSREVSIKETHQFSGVLLISIVSFLCIVLLLAFEIGVIYMTQSVTVTKTVDDGGLKIFTVGRGRKLRSDDWKGNQLEISHHDFTEGTTTRYVARAGITANVFPGQDIGLLEKASKSEKNTITVATFQLADDKRGSVLPLSTASDRKNKANFLTASVRHAEAGDFPFLDITLTRTLDTLGYAERSIFTDFGEFEGDLIRSKLFHHLGFNCTFVNDEVVEDYDGIVRYDKCTLHKRFGLVISAKTEIERAVKIAIKELVPMLFKVADYTEERGVESIGGQLWATEKYNGTVSIVRGNNSEDISFILICIAACLGIVKLVTASFIDYSGILKKYQFRELFERGKQTCSEVHEGLNEKLRTKEKEIKNESL